jgi:hypothetical protein
VLLVALTCVWQVHQRIWHLHSLPKRLGFAVQHPPFLLDGQCASSTKLEVGCWQAQRSTDMRACKCMKSAELELVSAGGHTVQVQP